MQTVHAHLTLPLPPAPAKALRHKFNFLWSLLLPTDQPQQVGTHIWLKHTLIPHLKSQKGYRKSEGVYVNNTSTDYLFELTKVPLAIKVCD